MHFVVVNADEDDAVIAEELSGKESRGCIIDSQVEW